MINECAKKCWVYSSLVLTKITNYFDILFDKRCATGYVLKTDKSKKLLSPFPYDHSWVIITYKFRVLWNFFYILNLFLICFWNCPKKCKKINNVCTDIQECEVCVHHYIECIYSVIQWPTLYCYLKRFNYFTKYKVLLYINKIKSWFDNMMRNLYKPNMVMKPPRRQYQF